MSRIKIDYGIDLGTTNSAICRMENGKPIIIKTDTLKDTLPSCVSFTRKKSIKIGDSAYNDMKSEKRRATKKWETEESNTYVEFKRSMGNDTLYHSSNMQHDYTSEELSSEVLKALKSFVIDEDFHSVVITVPTKFTANQKAATMKAAHLAGFDHCELLQEPIAAAMAYGLSSQEKNGIWMVFDFGGGTFDAALLKTEDGIMQVFDTEGDNYLGGKNLDYAIVDNIIIPYLQENYSIEGILADETKKEILREAMKTYAEELKIQLSFKDKEDIISNLGDLGEDDKGDEIELSLTITQEEFFNVVKPLFQKAIDICKDLLKRNNLKGSQISKLIVVGGPTHSPLIRQMLKEQITPNVDTSVDPMTVVATGAALYASTLDSQAKQDDIKVGTIKFDIGYESTTVETTEYVTVSLKEASTSEVFIEFIRGEKAWSSGKRAIDKKGDVIDVNLLEGKPNVFSIVAYDDKGTRLDCFPTEITIIQGTKVGSAPLPYNICMEIWSDKKDKALVTAFKGLEKNKPLPAIGVRNGLKTTNQLRPGVTTDILRVPIYQGDEGSEGKTAVFFEYVADVIVTGEEVEELIPQDSDIDITLKVDSSEMMKMDIFFPKFDITISKDLDTSKKQSIDEAKEIVPIWIKDAQKDINKLKRDGFDVSDLQKQLDDVKAESENNLNSDSKMVLQHLKEVLRKIEDMNSGTEWDRIEKELREEFERLEKANNELGTTESTQQVEEIREKVDQVIRIKDTNTARELLEQIMALYFQLTLIYQLIGFIRHYSEVFDSIQWKNTERARQLLNKGLEEINNNPIVENLQPIIKQVLDLLPNEEQANAQGRLKG
jgi:molecular chaperone DnaK